MSESGLLCRQAGCPLLEDGTCLENIAEPAECPNSFFAGDAQELVDTHPDSIEREIDSPPESESETPPVPDVIRIPGDEALSVAEADDLAGSLPSLLVLIAGEAEAGKTTLIVELYSQFLEGKFGDWAFAGSRTLSALDRRHQPARASSGSLTATTHHTQDPDLRFLHLELGKDQRRISLIMSDLKGELFENVVNGAPISKEVPIAKRADVCLLLVDGDQMRTTASRTAAFLRARQLLGGLAEDSGLRKEVRLMLVCSKSDLVPADQLDAVIRGLEGMRTLAGLKGLNAQILLLSARPMDTSKNPVNLVETLDWIVEEKETVAFSTDRGPDGSARFAWQRRWGK